MPLEEVIVQGTLKPDGGLELDERPTLAPGRVSVLLRRLPELPANDPFFDLLRGIWQARAAAGLAPRSVAEVEAERRRLREESSQELARTMEHQQSDPSDHGRDSPSNGGQE